MVYDAGFKCPPCFSSERVRLTSRRSAKRSLSKGWSGTASVRAMPWQQGFARLERQDKKKNNERQGAGPLNDRRWSMALTCSPSRSLFFSFLEMVGGKKGQHRLGFVASSAWGVVFKYSEQREQKETAGGEKHYQNSQSGCCERASYLLASNCWPPKKFCKRIIVTQLMQSGVLTRKTPLI